MGCNIPVAENTQWDSEHMTYRRNKENRVYTKPSDQNVNLLLQWIGDTLGPVILNRLKLSNMFEARGLNHYLRRWMYAVWSEFRRLWNSHTTFQGKASHPPEKLTFWKDIGRM
jgi:hypothetical protein